MSNQKYWYQLLGKSLTNCCVDDRYIVRKIDNHQRLILWSFDTPEQAQQAFETWQDEVLNENRVSLQLNRGQWEVYVGSSQIDTRVYRGDYENADNIKSAFVRAGFLDLSPERS